MARETFPLFRDTFPNRAPFPDVEICVLLQAERIGTQSFYANCPTFSTARLRDKSSKVFSTDAGRASGPGKKPHFYLAPFLYGIFVLILFFFSGSESEIYVPFRIKI